MTLLVVILILGCGSYLVGRSLDRHQDVAAIAGSTAVIEADREATATLLTRLAGVLAAVGPAQATAVTDRCSTLPGEFDNGGRVECYRVVTAYLGTSAPPDARWDQDLRRAGWSNRQDRSPPFGDPPLGYLKPPVDAVELDWVKQPATPAPQDGGTLATPGAVVDRERRTVDPAMFYPRYQYIVSLTVSDRYYPLNPVSTPPPR
jgi:hypothetical protein